MAIGRVIMVFTRPEMPASILESEVIMTTTIEVPVGGDIVTFGSWEEAQAFFTKPADPEADARDAIRADALRAEGAGCPEQAALLRRIADSGTAHPVVS